MTTRRLDRTVTRRATIAGAGVATLGLAMASSPNAAAQDGSIDMASHPMVGTWAALTSGGIVPQIHGADGSVIAAFPSNYVDPMFGLTFQGPALGRWEPDGERSARITFIQALADPAGAYIGTLQISSGIEVSEDGQTWTGGGHGIRLIVRDASNNAIVDEQIPPDPSETVAGIRLGSTVESVVLPVATPVAATPAS